MKKSLLALAALTAFAGAASAQSSVTLSGTFKAGVSNTKYSNGATGNGTGWAVGDGSSRFIISGVEDLGGGLFGIFQADTRFRIDDNGGAPSSSPLASGNTFVGLRGGFGTFRLGKLDTHYCLGSDQHGARATALAASSCGILGHVQAGASTNPAVLSAGTNRTIANASRSVNMIRYDLPALGGLSGGFGYSTSFQGSEGAVGNPGKGDAWNANIAYTLGTAFRVAASFWDAEDEPRTSGQRAWTVAVGGAFGPVDVGLTYDESRIDTIGATEIRDKRRAWSVPVVFTIGNGALLATYTRADDVKRSGAAGTTPATANGKVNNTGASLISVGYAHNLSKRTSLGVSYARMKNEAQATYVLYTLTGLTGHVAPVAGQDQNQLYFGIRHVF